MTTGLDEERDFLLNSLRDLEAERNAGDITEADYIALRDDYTARRRSPPPPFHRHDCGVSGARDTRKSTLVRKGEGDGDGATG